MCLDLTCFKGIGAAQDAARMQRVVSFYEKLPRGAAPEIQPKGLLGRYQARYFGKKPSAARELSYVLGVTCTVKELADILTVAIAHLIGFFLALGYANNYYFHLRRTSQTLGVRELQLTHFRTSQEQRSLSKA